MVYELIAMRNFYPPVAREKIGARKKAKITSLLEVSPYFHPTRNQTASLPFQKQTCYPLRTSNWLMMNQIVIRCFLFCFVITSVKKNQIFVKLEMLRRSV